MHALCTHVSARPPRTTQADPQAVAANKLATWPAATAPNQIWVGGITYLALATLFDPTQVTASLSRPGNLCDNALAESG